VSEIALLLNENAPASQSWRFVALEVRVISTKKEALQALSISQNVVWNPFTFRAKEIDESVDRGGDTLVNQTSSIRRSVLLSTKRLETSGWDISTYPRTGTPGNPPSSPRPQQPTGLFLKTACSLFSPLRRSVTAV
jgi:hypothetical protein